jgi:hypothetical protein
MRSSALLLEQGHKPLKRLSSLPEQVLFVAALALLGVSGLVEVAEGLRVSKRLDVHVLDADIGHCSPKRALRISPAPRDGQLANVDQSLNARGTNMVCKRDVIFVELSSPVVQV